jgi:hypothetical protein
MSDTCGTQGREFPPLYGVEHRAAVRLVLRHILAEAATASRLNESLLINRANPGTAAAYG